MVGEKKKKEQTCEFTQKGLWDGRWTTPSQPSHNGIAGYGGCVLIYRKKTQDVIAIDYNTAAPAATSEDMFTIEEAPDAPARLQGAGTRKRSWSIVYRCTGGRRWLMTWL